jgi:hypothetical protein
MKYFFAAYYPKHIKTPQGIKRQQSVGFSRGLGHGGLGLNFIQRYQ